MNVKIFKLITAIAAILLATASATSQEEVKRMYVMENGVATHKIDLSDIDSITFHNPHPIVDEGVVINGVRWATRNVAEPGRFAINPEDPGMFYQWNRKTAWSATAAYIPNWNTSYPAGDIWEEANDPSPAGWHVPTVNDFQKLLDRSKVDDEWCTENGINGRRFTDKESGKSIFLPAAGRRGGISGNTGLLMGAGESGIYLGNSSLYDSMGARSIYLGRINYAYLTNSNSTQGLSLRPVAD